MLIGAGAAAAWVALGGGRRAAAESPKAVVHETKIISRQPDYYHGWPTIARRKNGELLVVYSGGRERHVGPFGRVEMMRSHDDGKTWGWPCVILDMEIDVRDAGVMETDKRTLLVTTFTSTAYLKRLEAEIKRAEEKKKGAWTPEHIDNWRAAHERLTDEQRKQLIGAWMIRSTDDGLTWSQPYKCPVDAPHGPIQLADGRQLYAGKEIGGDGRIGVCQSTDDGQTWQWLAEIPARPGDDPAKDYHELHGVEAVDGRVIVQIRNHNKRNNNETLQTESSDGGRTWTAPHPIGAWGLPSHLLRLKDNRLLMTYGYRRKPYGNQARISADNGRAWSGPIVVSADGANGDLGYPSTVQLADGALLTVWYEQSHGGKFPAVLRQARWSLDQ
ncbi:MAG: exo-alpha-sialidase [Pirellulales bacterium]|nr:exo-alpha-sialidase [Pirellulales bacterium]